MGVLANIWPAGWVGGRGRKDQQQQPWPIDLANSQVVNTPAVASFKLQPYPVGGKPTPRRVEQVEGKSHWAAGIPGRDFLLSVSLSTPFILLIL